MFRYAFLFVNRHLFPFSFLGGPGITVHRASRCLSRGRNLLRIKQKIRRNFWGLSIYIHQPSTTHRIYVHPNLSIPFVHPQILTTYTYTTQPKPNK